jgi:isocitrate dehydrogenase
VEPVHPTAPQTAGSSAVNPGSVNGAIDRIATARVDAAAVQVIIRRRAALSWLPSSRS